MIRFVRQQGRAERTLVSQLHLLLTLAGARPTLWIIGVSGASLALAALDTIGVAAMVPLMQLVSGTGTDSASVQLMAALIGTDSRQALIPAVAVAIAVVFLVKSVAAIWFRWWLLGRTSRVSALAASELLRRYLLAPYAVHRTRRLNEVYRNISDSTMQATSVLLSTLSVITDATMLAAIVIVMAVTAPVVTLFTVVLFGVLVLGLQLLLRRRQARIGEEIAEAGLDSWGYMMPALDGFREARLTASAGTFIDGFTKARMRVAMAGRQLSIISELPRYALEVGFVLAIAGISAILFVGDDTAHALTVLGVFAAASVRALPALNRIAGSLATIRTGRVGMGIVQDAVEDLAAGGSHVETPRDGSRYAGEIVVQDLTYKYPDADTPVIDHLSLTIAENSTTAFVGSSGAGKTTLLDLILGLLDPTEGTIECGGRSIYDDRAAWYQGLGVVPQDVFLINDTLAANVAFGVPPGEIDRDRVWQTLAMAQLTDIARGLPDGLDTTLGERGVRLSGGQRQRLGLARALYPRPSVLVLDEATSALDNLTEHEITMTLAALKGSITIIVVAHRLSTVKDADNLVFLKDGHLDAMGTFMQLRASSRDFARLVELGDLT